VRPSPALRLAAVALSAGLLLLGSATAALAHPFGPPPTALVSARGSSVFVEWRAAPDDTAAIGVQLGFLDEAVLEAYLEAPTQAAPSAADEDALARSPELVAYLLDRVVVEQDGARCRGRVVAVEAFVQEGARVVLECPEPISAVDLEISLLHDVHEAYRTFAVAESEATAPAQAVFTTASPRQRFDFSGATTPGAEPTAPTGGEPGAIVGVAVVGGFLGLAALAGIVLTRRTS
jgi:hypothetical protein